MRRPLAATVLAATVLAATLAMVAGCGADEPHPTTSPPGAPAASDAAPATGAKAVCEAARNATTAGITALLTEMSKMIAASAANDTAGVEKAKAEARDVLGRLSAELRAQATRAAQADLRAALESTAGNYDRLAKNLDTIDENAFDQSADALEKICT